MASGGATLKHPRSPTLLIVLLLLVTEAGLTVGCLPIVRCPECPARRLQTLEEPAVFFMEPRMVPVAAPIRCLRCGDEGRITLLLSWRRTRGWEGRTVAVRANRGFRKTNSSVMLDRTAIRLGSPVTNRIVQEARETLLRSGAYLDVQIIVTDHPETPGKVKVLTIVTEP